MAMAVPVAPTAPIATDDDNFHVKNTNQKTMGSTGIGEHQMQRLIEQGYTHGEFNSIVFSISFAFALSTFNIVSYAGNCCFYTINHQVWQNPWSFPNKLLRCTIGSLIIAAACKIWMVIA